ncbi:hypothetical protein BEN71_01900 [Acinetobacter wuhouensis]|uniref:Uncharacterized protein YyaB-like PH domain-containing protein n=1 Tax=Acinetobacter wuhouensis TaxID=1879050 RepID=A0A385C1K7_9GAMM|nr:MULTISPECIES: PH domain-containing protein [Acinetobacter]AXQ20923.1 hypothetical protein BEN71_01900 [Acinetobacter wuhouensis]AYO55882.1 hypothetical protein CDG68_20545 [Acinetobacter wuhouensis]RZG72744.1 hypothetical protein EXU29_09600 [Acinetobacter wuhouensis]RZG73099.1 hypothetical protein EXE09_15835 [Acinetobacter sp. WCHAc060025]
MQTFRSKIDWWVFGFIVAMSGLLIQLLVTMYAKGTMQEYPEHTTVYILTVILLWLPLLTTRYVIKDRTLTIHTLIFKWVIQLDDIQKVSPTDHLDVSPALSLKRFKIEYLKDGKPKQILVSPRNPQKFYELVNTNYSK